MRNLRKVYGATVAVADGSFDVRAGEIFGLLGPNGSGKTTTVECLQGLRRADGGDLDVLGLDPRTDAGRVRRLVGSQLQDSALPPRLKVWEALCHSRCCPHRGRRGSGCWMSGGWPSGRDAAFGDLSGGQQQRLSSRWRLVNDPKLVILDEMTTGLDPAARRVAWGLVEAVRDRGATVILVTHSMEEAARLCDRLVVLHAGRVAAESTPAGLIAQATHDRRVSFTVPPATDLAFLDRVVGVERVRRDGAHVAVVGSGPLLARTAHALVEHGIEPLDLDVAIPTLEDAYLAVTAAAGGDGAGDR